MKEYIASKVYGIEDFNEISIKIKNDFEQLIREMQNNGIDVVVFLSPYHPKVFNTVRKDFPLVIKTEELVRNIADVNNIVVLSSFNPSILDMDSSFFRDGMHCKEFGIRKIFQVIEKNDSK